MAELHPRISLDVEVATTDAAAVLLVSGQAEVAVAYNLQPRRDLHVLWSSELPFGCVIAPGHPLARHRSASLQQIAAYPDRAAEPQPDDPPLPRRTARLAVPRHAGRGRDELAAADQAAGQDGPYAAFTSELDAAPEVLEGSLVFLPVRDASAEPQTVSVVIDGRRSLPRVARIVSDLLVDKVSRQLAAVRASGGGRD